MRGVKHLFSSLFASFALFASLRFNRFCLRPWPVALFILRDRPSDVGQYPDGLTVPPKELSVESRTFKELVTTPTFWLLLLGHEHHAEAAFANLFQQLIRTNECARTFADRRWRWRYRGRARIIQQFIGLFVPAQQDLDALP